MNKPERAAVAEFTKEVGEMKASANAAIESTKGWKRANSTRKRPGRGGSSSSSKRSKGNKGQVNSKKTQESDSESDNEIKIGADGMKERLIEAMDDTSITIPAWFAEMMKAEARNRFIDAAEVLLFIAPGIEEAPTETMFDELMEVLSDDFEKQVLGALDKTSVGEIEPKELHYYFKATTGSKSVLNKHPRGALLQHIVLGVHSLKSALGWARLERGIGENGKSTVVKQTYEVECEGNEADFESREFELFASRLKDYHTGCNRFLAAYRRLGSILLLCPRLRFQRFADSRLGPELGRTVRWFVLPEDEYRRREGIHRQVLDLVIAIIEDTEKPELVKALQDIEEELCT
ncbi:unnamed protein product [Rhizoctonia solani]|uniref:Uncharacterized protein n=1 Tax=Rhizoctonia solani TaxID=456999 RepID=A0A8H3GYM4_9AGAM|nr:unnamed protein product [Rhizoctonia solani]